MMNVSPLFLRNQPNEIKTIYTFKCSVCLKAVEMVVYGEYFVAPSLPAEGWREYGRGAWVCADHEVVILVDGKVFDGRTIL